MKRFTSLFIAIVMVLSVLGSVDAVYAQEPPVWTAGENVKVTVDEGVLTVSGNGDMQNYSKSNLPGWNRNNGEIVKIVVEKGVTSIGDFAFSSTMTFFPVSSAKRTAATRPEPPAPSTTASADSSRRA